jgi:hypothetical protein
MKERSMLQNTEEIRYAYRVGNTELTLGADSGKHGLTSVKIGGQPFDLIRSPYFGLNLYRIMYGGRLRGYARTEPFRVKAEAENGITLAWQSTRANPCRLEATYTVLDEFTVELAVSLEALEYLPNYELSVSTYFDFALEPYALIPPWPGKTDNADLRLLKLEDHPLVKGHYIYFPRDSKAAATLFDGRWIDGNTGRPIAHFVSGPCYGRPIGIMASNELTAVQMADPATCSAISITYASDETDSIRHHNAVYFTLFGCDLEPGDSKTARIRQTVLPGSPDKERILKLYSEFQHNG